MSNESDLTPVLTWKELHAANYAFQSEFLLSLDDGSLIQADQIVRLVPGKRMVVFGRWQGKSIVAKLFFDPQDAKRHAERDLAGIKTLQDNRIPTPDVYYHGMGSDKRVSVILFEHIKTADNLDMLWRQREDDQQVLPELKKVIVELATQHVFGITQQDLHLQNFLVAEKTVYTLDGGQIYIQPGLLPKAQSMDNLALFLSQLGVGTEKLQEALFRHYAIARGWVLKRHDRVDLFLMIRQWRQKRWQQYEKKIQRECTRFTRIGNWRINGMADRHALSPALRELLANPDHFFNLPGVKLLKDGRSSTVIRLHIDGRDLVIKRYNLKSTWHWLRRCLRPTRASQSWRLAHKMNLFGILTAKPIAYLDYRYAWLRGKSYFISEYITGDDIGIYLSRHFLRPQKMQTMVTRMVQLLRGLQKLNLTHGDLKASNILVNEVGQPLLIDLDGTEEHLSLSGLRKAWVHEIRRFLRNFNDTPAVQALFEAELHSH